MEKTDKKTCGIDCGCTDNCQRPVNLEYTTPAAPVAEISMMYNELSSARKELVNTFIKEQIEQASEATEEVIKIIDKPVVESQEELWKEVIQLVDYNDYEKWEYVSQILSEKFILTRRNP